MNSCAEHPPCRLAAAERLYGARSYTDALVAGQALLTAPAADHDEQARVHAFVSRCLEALGEHVLAARHGGLAGAPVGVERRRSTQPLYWPTERRGRA